MHEKNAIFSIKREKVLPLWNSYPIIENRHELLYASKRAAEFLTNIIRDSFPFRMEGSGGHKHFSEEVLQVVQIVERDAYFL